MNTVHLMGNITKNLELRYTPNGKAILSFSIAHNDDYKDAQGNVVKRCYFIDCKSFGKTAEFIGKYWIKGKQILIEGKLVQETWKDKEEKNHSKVVVIVERVHFTGKKEKEAEATSTETGLDL